jgi:hypothetical protein
LAQQKRDEKAAEKAAKVLEVPYVCYIFCCSCSETFVLDIVPIGFLRTKVSSLLNPDSFHFEEEIYTVPVPGSVKEASATYPVLGIRIRIRNLIRRIRMFLGLPDPDPLVIGTDPDLAPDPSNY